MCFLLYNYATSVLEYKDTLSLCLLFICVSKMLLLITFSTVLHHFHHEDKVLSEEECKDIALARGDWERKLASYLSLKPIENFQESVQFLEKERFDSDVLQCLKGKLL